MNHTRKLVIIGSTHHNTYSMVRCFSESGIKPDVILYGKSDSYILQSVFINDSHVAPDATGALRLLQDCYSEAVVIACTDEIASMMDLQYDGLNTKYDFFNCGATGKLTHFMDKAVQSRLASEVGFPVPDFVEGKPGEIRVKRLHYPCIIKPLESIHGGKNLQICKHEDELPAVLSAFDTNEKVLVQEFVKKDYEIVIVGLSYEDKVVIPAYVHKYRDTKGGTTYSAIKPVSFLPKEVLMSCKKMVKTMCYKGLFGIELIRRGNDYYFVEINLRNDATTYAICVAGCNLPLSFWKICNRESADNFLAAPIRTINSMVEFNDFIHVLKRDVSIRTWKRQWKEAECKYCYSKADARVYRSQKKDFVKFVIKMMITHLYS
ncbi:MAG: ATP-grasp domain-containing protein [Bacteroidaceae bacterium]|nr:ATP-grasp domain-containing protein [Bacteroidaceae bacterium]